MEVVEALGDDVVHRRALVQRGGGVLEHHLHVAYDLAVEAAGYLAGDAHALVEYLARRAGVGAYDGAAYRGLAGAGLADEGEGLALVDVEARVLHGADEVLALAEVDVDVLEREEHLPAALVYRAVLGKVVRAGVQRLGSFSLAMRTASYMLKTFMSVPWMSRIISGFSTFGARGSSSQVLA